MEKGEIAHLEQFHIFPQCFLKFFFFNGLKRVDLYMEGRLNVIKLDVMDRNPGKSSGESRARSDCRYVQSDLALHSPQKKSMVGNRQDWG